MARTRRLVYARGTIRKERVLPLPGNTRVTEGQVVEADTVLAETEIVPGDPYVIDLGSRFNLRGKIDPETMERAILKNTGDRIHRGELVVKMPAGGAGSNQEVESPVDGVVEFVSYAKGRLLVREEVKSARPVEVINVARQLGVWPALVRMHMRYNEGDEVLQGSILAASPDALTKDAGYIYSPVNGMIERIDAHTGNVYIVRRTSITQVRAYIPGTVESVIPERGAVIRGHGVTAQGIYGVGGERSGRLMVRAENPGDVLTAADISKDDEGLVLVAGSLVDGEALERAREVGASAVIAGGIRQGDLVRFVGAELEGAVTGGEEIDVTVIITEGFGRMPMAPELFEVFSRLEGSPASVNGRTQVRAGAVRPEIIISKDIEGLERSIPAAPEASISGFLSAGDVVRIVRGHHFGAWGQVTDLPLEDVKLESEITAQVATVKLDTGEEVTVLQENLEAFSPADGGGHDA